MVRTDNLWSLRKEYRASITDNPTYEVTMELGDDRHSIEDYVGRAVGMPAVVTAFEDAIDEAAGSADWVTLSVKALEQLKREGFDFSSQQGRELLARAVAKDSSQNDEALVRLIALGAPVDTRVHSGWTADREDSLIDVALTNGHEQLVEALLKLGVLLTDGRADQAKIDAAFQAAIAGGKLSLVIRVWDATELHPALTFSDAASDEESPTQQSPVTLLLRPPYRSGRKWEGKQIAEWLNRKGCSLSAHSANGGTLLHIAAAAEDIEFVRFLLNAGVDPSTPGRFGLPALGSVHDNEDISMLLLEAGTDVSSLSDKGNSFRNYAIGRHWQRVVAWLDTHHQP